MLDYMTVIEAAEKLKFFCTEDFVDLPLIITGKLKGLEIQNGQIQRIISFQHIIDSEAIRLPNEVKDELKNIVFNCFKCFSKLEKNLIGYVNIVNDTLKLLTEKEYEVTHNRINWEDPTYELHDVFSEFLIQANIVLRYKTRFTMKIFNNPALKEFVVRRKWINRILAENKGLLRNEEYESYKKFLFEDRKWLQELIGFRNKMEHVEDEDIEITKFQIILKDKAVTGVVFPGIEKNKKFIHHYMAETFYNVFTHIEDYFAMLLNLFCDENFKIMKVLNEQQTYKEECISGDLGKYIYDIQLKSELMTKILHYDDNSE